MLLHYKCMNTYNIQLSWENLFKTLVLKPASHCPILKSLMALVLTNIIGCDSCLLRSYPIFRSHCPTDRIRFLFCLSHNAFLAIIEMNNRMRSIRWSLTCQSPSDSIRFSKIASDRPIVHSHCPNFPSDFPSDPSNHQIIWQWDAGLKILKYDHVIVDLKSIPPYIK